MADLESKDWFEANRRYLTALIGRLHEHEGQIANEIVLVHSDPESSKRISRWHAELQMTTGGYVLRAVTRAATEVDGQPLGEGDIAPIRPGAVVRLGKVLTLNFRTPSTSEKSTFFG